MNDCVFCKIVSGEIPAYKLYEDEFVCAFLDACPATKGHTLVVPKKHADNLLSLDTETSKRILEVAKKIVKGLQKVYEFNDFNLIQNNGSLAGQTVHHFHLHIIPRYKEDEVKLWAPRKDDSSVCEEMANKIKKSIDEIC